MEKPLLAIVASDGCKEDATIPRPWFHLPQFLRTFEDVLIRYEICSTEATAIAIEGILPHLRVRHVGSDLRGIVKLASEIAKKNIPRVLAFLDPASLQVYRPEYFTLLRNCSLGESILNINYAAYLWANNERQKHQSDYRERLTNSFRNQTIAFIAHEPEKPSIARFVICHRDILKKFLHCIGTSGTIIYTRELLGSVDPEHERLSLEIAGALDKRSAHGPSGGDVVIADEIFEGRCDHVVFFIDHQNPHPHEPDIQVLLRSCIEPNHQVNLILSHSAATEWIERYKDVKYS